MFKIYHYIVLSRMTLLRKINQTGVIEFRRWNIMIFIIFLFSERSKISSEQILFILFYYVFYNGKMLYIKRKQVIFVWDIFSFRAWTKSGYKRLIVKPLLFVL